MAYCVGQYIHSAMQIMLLLTSKTGGLIRLVRVCWRSSLAVDVGKRSDAPVRAMCLPLSNCSLG